MADDFRVTGADAFLALSRRLKAAGEKELRKELNKSLRDAAKPLIPLTRAAARRRLPKKNGLNEIVARTPQRVRVRTGQQTAGVQVVTTQRQGSAARGANAGRVRHPVFGDTQKWVEQRVEPGWFDETLEQNAPTVALPGLEAAVKDMLERVARNTGAAG